MRNATGPRVAGDPVDRSGISHSRRAARKIWTLRSQDTTGQANRVECLWNTLAELALVFLRFKAISPCPARAIEFEMDRLAGDQL